MLCSNLSRSSQKRCLLKLSIMSTRTRGLMLQPGVRCSTPVPAHPTLMTLCHCSRVQCLQQNTAVSRTLPLPTTRELNLHVYLSDLPGYSGLILIRCQPHLPPTIILTLPGQQALLHLTLHLHSPPQHDRVSAWQPVVPC